MPAIHEPEPVQHPLFIERPDELWEFRGKTFDEHVGCWQEIDGQVQKDKWKLSSVAASLETKYDEKTIDRFAHETRRSARRIREYAQTWRVFENGARAPILSFSHHVKAASAPDPALAIQTAEDEEMSVHELEQWIRKQKPKEPKLKLSPALQALHDQAVREDLDLTIAAIRERDRTPVDPLLSTLNRLIIEHLEWQRDRTIDGDIAKVVEAVDDGCWTGQDIFDWLHSHLYVMSDEQFDDRVEQAIERKKIDYSKQGGKGERARGDRTAMYVLHGARSGDAYNSHKTSSIYSQGESD